MKGKAKYSIWRRGYNRLNEVWRNHQWLIIGGFWLATFALGCAGTMKQLKAPETLGEKRSPTDPFYRAMQLYFMDDSMITAGPALPLELELARFLAPVVAAYTALATLAAVFRERLKMFSLRFTKNHVVLCGLGRKGLLLAKGFLENNYRVVVIEQNTNNNLLEQGNGHGIILLTGNAKRAGNSSARRRFIRQGIWYPFAGMTAPTQKLRCTPMPLPCLVIAEAGF